MAPQHVKAAAIGLALVSLALFAAAQGNSVTGNDAIDERPPSRRGWRGSMTLDARVALVFLGKAGESPGPKEVT